MIEKIIKSEGGLTANGLLVRLADQCARHENQVARLKQHRENLIGITDLQLKPDEDREKEKQPVTFADRMELLLTMFHELNERCEVHLEALRIFTEEDH